MARSNHSEDEVKIAFLTVSLYRKEMQSSTVSSKGQVTIPISIRQRLGLREGDRVEFVSEQGKIVLRPAREIVDPFSEYVGILPAFGSRDEVVQWVQQLRDDEPRE